MIAGPGSYGSAKRCHPRNIPRNHRPWLETFECLNFPIQEVREKVGLKVGGIGGSTPGSIVRDLTKGDISYNT